MDDLREMVALLKPETKAKLLGQNVAGLYDIKGRRPLAQEPVGA